MPDPLDVAVVGAGPYGLSVAAAAADRRTRLFGEPLRTWRRLMPPEMLLRSAWHETSLAARDGRGTIDEYAADAGVARIEPLPLQRFLDYADWFRERYVADHDPAAVVHVERDGAALRVVTAAGAEHVARTVVAAVGATPFPYAPPPLAAALGEGVAFAIDQVDLTPFAGRRVVVVGAGQSGLETAARALDAGAEVEVITRSGIRWFADHEPRERGPLAACAHRLAYPVLGYGPPPLNRLARHPDAFAALSPSLRRRAAARMLRAGGSPWLRGRVEGRVAETTGTTVRAVERGASGLRLVLADETVREADHVLVATGYRFRLDRLDWLGERLRGEVATAGGWPVLDRAFRSTARGLRFVGYPAEGRFGPVARFVLGAPFAARRVGGSLP
jgi:thioredoxin reductase